MGKATMPKEMGLKTVRNTSPGCPLLGRARRADVVGCAGVPAGDGFSEVEHGCDWKSGAKK